MTLSSEKVGLKSAKSAAAKNDPEPLLWIGPDLQGGKPLGLQVLLHLPQVKFAGNFRTDTFPLG
jgi:hypothetical protein